jgi:hypothetical protein
MTITEILDECRIRFWRHGESSYVTANWIGVECPFCGGGSNRPGLGFSFQSHRWGTCWKCGPHSLWDVLTAYEVPRERIRGLLGQLSPERRQSQPETRGKLELPAGLGELGRAHRRYLEGRGFDPDELAQLWGLRGIGVAASLAWRIFIPIRRDGETVSWTTRALSNDVPPTERYRGAGRGQESVPRAEVLFGEEYVRHGVVVTEGPFDVFAVGPGAVCTCGTGFSRGQVRRLVRYPIRVVAFDRDAGRRARQLADALSPFPGSTYLVQLSGKDPAETPRREIRELRRRFLE